MTYSYERIQAMCISGPSAKPSWLNCGTDSLTFVLRVHVADAISNNTTGKHEHRRPSADEVRGSVLSRPLIPRALQSVLSPMQQNSKHSSEDGPFQKSVRCVHTAICRVDSFSMAASWVSGPSDQRIPFRMLAFVAIMKYHVV